MVTTTKEPLKMSFEERLIEAKRLEQEYRAILATPSPSEGNVSPAQLGMMSKRQSAKYGQDLQRKIEIEAQIRELRLSDEELTRRSDWAVAEKKKGRIEQLQRQIEDLRSVGIGKTGEIRPSYQRTIEIAEAELKTLQVKPTAPEVTYDASLEAFRKASREFTVVRDAYRAKQIGDVAFRKAKTEFDKASEVADAAETAFINAKNELAKVAPAITSDMPESYVQARKRPDNKWQLFFIGTRNEVFPNQLFTSASDAKMAFRVAKAKQAKVAPATSKYAKLESQLKDPEWLRARIGALEKQVESPRKSIQKTLDLRKELVQMRSRLEVIEKVAPVAPGVTKPLEYQAEKFSAGLNARSVFEDGEVRPDIGYSWRSMGQKEFEQTTSAGTTLGAAQRGRYWSWFPEYSSKLEGKVGSPKYLIEVKVKSEGETLTRAATPDDITGIWRSEGKGWVKFERPEVTIPKAEAAAPQVPSGQATEVTKGLPELLTQQEIKAINRRAKAKQRTTEVKPSKTQIQLRPQSKSRGMETQPSISRPKTHPHLASQGGSPKGKVHVPRPPREKRLTLAQLRKIEQERSQQSQRSDLRQFHSTVVTSKSPRVKSWITHPGQMDIKGIDTPKNKPLPKNRERIPKNKEPLPKEARITHAHARLPGTRPRGKITRR